jgi:hypothetical protein
MGVTYGVADFITGRHIADLPVMTGASWSRTLNKADAVTCRLDVRDDDIRDLDIRSITSPKKMVLFARTDDDTTLAWGVISGRDWNDTEKTLGLRASGGLQYFNQRIIAPLAAKTEPLVLTNGKPNTALDTVYTNRSLASVARSLVEQAVAWPGSPAFTLPAVGTGDQDRTYKLLDFKTVGAALTDLTNLEDGVDIAFDARRYDGPNGPALEYIMRIGNPYLGVDVGSWPVGGPASPVTGLTVDDEGADIATSGWMTGGKSDSKVVASRRFNDTLLTRGGYPPLDLVDTSRNSVSSQRTLDGYNGENLSHADGPYRSLSFSLSTGETALGLGGFGPGDWVTLDVAAGNYYITPGEIRVRVMAVSGDETSDTIKVDVMIDQDGGA